MENGTKAGSTLMAHVDCDMVNRKDLIDIPTPEATDSYFPVPHIQLVETLQAQLLRRMITIEREQFAVRADGSRLFATFDLAIHAEEKTSIASLGLRTSHDKSLSIQIVAGMRVFVCDNLVLSGDFVALKRKHTSGLDLPGEIYGALDLYMQHHRKLVSHVSDLQARELTDEAAKAIMFDAFRQKVMPTRLLESVATNYFEPPHAEFQPRTAWSLHNAFTEVAKELPLNVRMRATQELGSFFGMKTAA
jgi:Domain of unknown function (DUF932)